MYKKRGLEGMSKKRGGFNQSTQSINLAELGVVSIILLSFLLFIIPSIIGDIPDGIYPSINFTYPTPFYGEHREESYVDIKINITEEDLRIFKWNWDGTNYTFYYDSLALMFNFDNIAELGEYDGYVKDLSVYGNDGTVYGATYTEGKKDGGLKFQNKNDYVDVADSISLDLEEFSVEFWFKPDENYGLGSNYMGFVVDDDYEIYMENGRMVFDYKGSKVSSTNSDE